MTTTKNEKEKDRQHDLTIHTETTTKNKKIKNMETNWFGKNAIISANMSLLE